MNLCLSQIITGSVYPLLRAPPKSGSGADLDTSLLVPVIFLLASSDAATALIDPTLPRTIAVTATAAAVFGTAANNWILPILNQVCDVIEVTVLGRFMKCYNFPYLFLHL